MVVVMIQRGGGPIASCHGRLCRCRRMKVCATVRQAWGQSDGYVRQTGEGGGEQSDGATGRALTPVPIRMNRSLGIADITIFYTASWCCCRYYTY